jgi:hypothetical protein
MRVDCIISRNCRISARAIGVVGLAPMLLQERVEIRDNSYCDRDFIEQPCCVANMSYNICRVAYIML